MNWIKFKHVALFLSCYLYILPLCNAQFVFNPEADLRPEYINGPPLYREQPIYYSTDPSFFKALEDLEEISAAQQAYDSPYPVMGFDPLEGDFTPYMEDSEESLLETLQSLNKNEIDELAEWITEDGNEDIFLGLLDFLKQQMMEEAQGHEAKMEHLFGLASGLEGLEEDVLEETARYGTLDRFPGDYDYYYEDESPSFEVYPLRREYAQYPSWYSDGW